MIVLFYSSFIFLSSGSFPFEEKPVTPTAMAIITAVAYATV